VDLLDTWLTPRIQYVFSIPSDPLAALGFATNGHSYCILPKTVKLEESFSSETVKIFSCVFLMCSAVGVPEYRLGRNPEDSEPC
jgi:hypothetical protein